MYDIFKVEPDGQVLWQSVSPNLETAKSSVKELIASGYLIVNLRTGERIPVQPAVESDLCHTAATNGA